MAKRVRTEDAAEVYEWRHRRPWREDAAFGLVLAASAQVKEHIVRGVVSIGREGSDKRPFSRPEPLPEWCVRALTRFHAHGGHPRLGVVTDPRCLEIAEHLSSNAEWSERERAAWHRTWHPRAPSRGRKHESPRDYGGFRSGSSRTRTWSQWIKRAAPSPRNPNSIEDPGSPEVSAGQDGTHSGHGVPIAVLARGFAEAVESDDPSALARGLELAAQLAAWTARERVEGEGHEPT